MAPSATAYVVTIALVVIASWVDLSVLGVDIECPDKFPTKIPEWHQLSHICSNLEQFKIKGQCATENCSICIPPNSYMMKSENREVQQWIDLYRSTQRDRRGKLQALLTANNVSPTDEDPVILMVINRGYLYLFYNFVCSLDYNSIEGVKERILVIPTDEETQRAIEKTGIMTFYPDWLGEKLLQRISPAMAASFALGAHRWVISLQVGFLNDLVELGYNVVLQDSDVIWLRNAFTYLKQPHLSHLDVQMSVDGRMDFRGPGNSGFVYIKNSCKSKVFTKTMVHLIGLVLVGRSDQILWNMLLDENIFRQIHFETLDVNYFVSGYQINLQRGIKGGKLPDTSIMVHASWTTDQFDKVEKFYMADVWYFSEEKCPQLYEYELLPDLKERKWHIRDKTQEQEQKFKELKLFRDSTNGKYVRSDKYDALNN